MPRFLENLILESKIYSVLNHKFRLRVYNSKKAASIA